MRFRFAAVPSDRPTPVIDAMLGHVRLGAATFAIAPVHAAPPQSRNPPPTSSACRIRTDHAAWQGIPLGLEVNLKPGGTTVPVLTGTAVDSLFRGATVVQTKLLPATDLTACLTS